MDFYYQEPQTVLDFLKEKKNTLLESDYVAPPKEDIVGSSAIAFFDFLINAYEEKAKEETEPDIFSSDIPQVSPEAFMESSQKGDTPTAEQLGAQLLDQEELGTKEQIIGIEDGDAAPAQAVQAIKQTNTSDADSKEIDSAKGINSREEAEKEDMGMRLFLSLSTNRARGGLLTSPCSFLHPIYSPSDFTFSLSSRKVADLQLHIPWPHFPFYRCG